MRAVTPEQQRILGGVLEVLSKPPEPPPDVHAGRPTKYRPEYVETARQLCERGATDFELSEYFDVAWSTLKLWKIKHPEFSAALKAGKEIADNLVERSLYQRAVGYSHPDVHISNYQGTVAQTPITKHYPPETVACIFWLKNRRSAEWRDRIAHTDPNGDPLGTGFIDKLHGYELARRMAFLLKHPEAARPALEHAP